MITEFLAFDATNIDAIENELVANGAFSTTFSDISTLLNSGASLGIVDIFFFIAGGAFLIYFILGGIQFMLSSGEPKKVADAKQTLQNALVGLFIVVLAFMIVRFLGAFLGLPGVSQTLG